MMPRPLRIGYLFACVLCLALICSCAGREYLIVDYKTPAPTQELRDQVVRLLVEDRRENSRVMTPAAAAKFKEFSDRYSLAWVTPANERILAGEHDLSALFKRAFEKRLMLIGAETAHPNNTQAPELSITLETFTIDLQGQKWLAEVRYRATLTQQGHPIVREQIQGNAERIKIIGRKGADFVISDIFTEVVNRLDMVTLFQKAELIP